MTHTKEPEQGASEPRTPEFTSIEICAGAGGQAIGLHLAGFGHLALIEIDKYAAATLRENIEVHPKWDWERDNCDVLCQDVLEFEPQRDLKKSAGLYRRGEVDLLVGGVPCRRSRMLASNSVKTMSVISSLASWLWPSRSVHEP